MKLKGAAFEVPPFETVVITTVGLTKSFGYSLAQSFMICDTIP
ncbi:MAG: hypothetical protein SCAL_000131 [Candidatus Syntrophoarchaeum caldarius]|uniref:Uncharacterized protein n=1 Tax=Candidatus Syntropharchaeum caldarium TaxID=1838285 RepID=A0A1F2PBN0_9EURY|nr:MAG: hypothetical protein SCAL_000131 [Candidatus Syntrophoarchaeum caldarius]